MIQGIVFVVLMCVAYTANIKLDSHIAANRNAVAIEKIMRDNNLLYEDAEHIFYRCSEV